MDARKLYGTVVGAESNLLRSKILLLMIADTAELELWRWDVTEVRDYECRECSPFMKER
jgi:hypothetical protein